MTNLCTHSSRYEHCSGVIDDHIMFVKVCTHMHSCADTCTCMHSRMGEVPDSPSPLQKWQNTKHKIAIYENAHTQKPAHNNYRATMNSCGLFCLHNTFVLFSHIHLNTIIDPTISVIYYYCCVILFFYFCFLLLSRCVHFQDLYVFAVFKVICNGLRLYGARHPKQTHVHAFLLPLLRVPGRCPEMRM